MTEPAELTSQVAGAAIGEWLDAFPEEWLLNRIAEHEAERLRLEQRIKAIRKEIENLHAWVAYVRRCVREQGELAARRGAPPTEEEK